MSFNLPKRLIRKYVLEFLDRRKQRKSIKILKSLQAFGVVKNVKDARLTYLSYNKFAQIVKTIEGLKRNNVDGVYIEAGCALGGSAIVISKLKPREKYFFVYDVFEMIPTPTKDDPADVVERYDTIVQGKSKGIGGDVYYGYMSDLYKVVQENFVRFNINIAQEHVNLVKGLLQDTMVLSGPVAFAHIDVDWYEPVKVSLERIAPMLTVGGSIILDDYYDWGGCRKATDEFLENVPGQFEINNEFGNLRLERVKPA